MQPYQLFWKTWREKVQTMEINELDIKGVWLLKFPIHTDERGHFREWFKAREIEALVGKRFDTAQANISLSNNGALRGIHYSIATGGQAKLVTCVTGSIWDVVVDLRENSPTYKKSIGTILDSSSGQSILVAEGLGHGFVSLKDNSIVAYLLTEPYSKDDELGVHPFDEDLAIEWPVEAPIISIKDLRAPSLRAQLEAGKLPRD